MEEFEVIEESRIHGEGRPNNTYNPYQLISSAYEKNQDDLVEKVQQHYINPQLVAQITHQLKNDALVYSPQLTLEIGVKEHPQQVREVVFIVNQFGLVLLLFGLVLLLLLFGLVFGTVRYSRGTP
ncbi:unnamed protein product [Meloidogyne enterolobii]|uniref:Uncharacterized protein n=1 Tax=Meloidogyne enterolobii TaxID=390850 RepID=A0ACB0YGS1_MELEN